MCVDVFERSGEAEEKEKEGQSEGNAGVVVRRPRTVAREANCSAEGDYSLQTG